jgi:hypothetical protein
MSWQQRFFEIRVPFFIGNLVLVAIALAAQAAFAAFSAGIPPMLLLGVFAVVGLTTRDVRAHSVIVILALLVQAVGFGGALFVTQPS